MNQENDYLVYANQLKEQYNKMKAEYEERIRILRLIENMTMGRNAVGYLTESMHGAGSPQAQRIQIQRLMQVEYKKRLARVLAGLDVDKEDTNGLVNELGHYFERVFKVEPN